MDGASIENALGRMNAAMARIERAAARLASADPENLAAIVDESGLQARHEQLRADVAQSLRQLDALLAGQQP